MKHMDATGNQPCSTGTNKQKVSSARMGRPGRICSFKPMSLRREYPFWLFACTSFVLRGVPALVGATENQATTSVGRRVPVFPDAFQVAYNWTLPYESNIQTGGLTYDVRIWRDAKHQQYRMDTYAGSNSLITTKELSLEVVPQLDKLACMAYEPDANSALLGAPILPDVRDWEYKGRTDLHNQAADLWEFKQRHEAKVTIYKFYVTPEGAPLRLYMHGNDLFTGAHFDKYIADYTEYTPGIQDNGVFDRPAVCGTAPVEKPSVRPFLLRMASLLPSIHPGGQDAEYDDFVALHGRRHASQQDYDSRRQIFHRTRAALAQANSKGLGFSQAINRFADWTQEEYEAVMLPRKGQRSAVKAAAGHGSAELPYERKVPKGRIPLTVDWRHTGADSFVKDQAVCGSCWAFSTTGTLEAAYFLATGKNASFSEQQLMDCSWGYRNNHACGGGDQEEAVQYLVEGGGIAPEALYNYMGQDGFCRAKNISADQLVKIKGFVNVPAYDDEALMEAIYSRGPVSVSLDASQPGFRFYSDGVFDSPTCMYKPHDLDHAVLAVGYGTTHTGQDYWLIRNSWSRYWGNDGYIRIAREGPGRACGITSGPMYAVIDDGGAQSQTVAISR